MAEINNVHPVHLNFQFEGSDSTHTSLYSPYQNSTLSYQTFNVEGSNSTHTSLVNSGYQYFLGAAASAAPTEEAFFLDSVAKTVTVAITEKLGFFDYAETRPLQINEDVFLKDTANIVITQQITEELFLYDSLGTNNTNQENSLVKDFLQKIVTVSFSEKLFTTDLVYSFAPISGNGSVNIKGLVDLYGTGSSKIILLSELTPAPSQITINAMPNISASGNSFAFFTGSSPTSVANPFNPTLSINGQTYYGSNPPTNAQCTMAIDIPNSGFPNNTWAQMFNYGFNLDYSGGSFDVTHLNSAGTIGDSINAFGLRGSITRVGQILTNSAKGFITAGIFGDPLLNRQLNLIAGSNPLSKIVVSNTTLQTNTVWQNQNGQAQQVATNYPYMTAQSIAQIVARAAGIHLYWTVSDVPVIDFSFEPGMTALSALQSMADRVGATLRWTGGLSYMVAYPDFSLGEWVIPSPNVINASGIEYTALLDLETGIGGAAVPGPIVRPSQGVYTVPASYIPFTGQTGQTSGPLQTGALPPIDVVYSTRQVVTAEDPVILIPLPPDYDEVYIQVIVPTPHGLPIALTGGVTNDNSQWLPIVQSANLGLFSVSKLGKSDIPQFRIDPSLFPTTDSDVSAGNFVLNVGVSRIGLDAALNNQQQTLDQLIRSMQARVPKFIRTYEGTINTVFFGSIPLPGMYTGVNVDGYTVQGIIESVTFTPPGFITVHVAQYKRMQLYFPATSPLWSPSYAATIVSTQGYLGQLALNMISNTNPYYRN